MHAFRMPIPPRPLRLLCVVVDSGSVFASAFAPPSLIRCPFSSAAVSQSRSHRPTSFSPPQSVENASPVPEELESSQVRDKGSGSVIGKGAISSSNSNPRNSTIKSSRIGNWKSSLFDSLFPEGASRPIRRKPIGRLDISEDSTYLPDPMEGLARRRRVDTGNWAKPRAYGPQERMSRNGKLELGRKKPLGRLTTAPSTLQTEQASVVFLRGVGTTMLGSDISRLLPSEASLPGFGKFLGILRITPDRHPVTLQQRPKYTIEFSDAASAKKFVYSLNLDYQLANPPPMTTTTLPPASTPKVSLPVQAAEQVKNDLRTLRGTLASGKCQLGSSVLLVASGLGGDTKENGKLPRTEEVRQMLEEADVQFCVGDQEDGGVGVQRILQLRITDSGFKVRVRADGSSRGAESKWIVRCRDPAEAHRVVRDWNARELPNGLGKFMAEMIY